MTTEPVPRKRPTLLDVAQLSGLSHQTVSRFFRDNTSLKPRTRERVEAAVRELNYRPNLTARSMRTRQTGRIAVVVPTLAYSPARMLAGASSTAHAAGFGVDVISIEGGADARTDRVLDLADSGQVDGVVSFAPLNADVDLTPTTATILVAAELDDEMRGIGELADAAPVAAMIERLAEAGHTRFLHITGSLQFASARARLEQFRASLGALGLSGEVVEGDWTAEAGLEAVLAFGDDHPTAVIAASDIIAAGVIRGARRRGWSVPEDLSVTGWDNHPLGQYLYPSLTTVDVDLERVGSTAMARLIAALRGEPAPPAAHSINQLVWGESTGPAPR
ncbi:LacI family DNA-binding transcriptional regulator [Agromyces sp. LHK192]|uniref:LacI family DNA-binding transcriptional regulator n=1 Tax=Agromyces sp. LHK192 TaxID=2498704 RepID=UPI000FD7D089|nr:LacI family DNA-binding transcriptional regulator [Agromyces sp. LHK192]